MTRKISADSSGEIYGALRSDGDLIFALVQDRDTGRIVAFDQSLESVLWEHTAEEWATFRPLVSDGAIVLGTRGQICSFRTSDGSPVGCMPIDGIARSLAISGEQILVGTIGGAVHTFPLDR